MNVALRGRVGRREPEAAERAIADARGPASAGWVTLAIAAGLLVACWLVGRRLQADGYRLYTLVPPLTGRFDPRAPIGAIVPAAVGLVVVRTGPALARRIAWPSLLVVAALGALAWSAGLAAVDGADGFLAPASHETDYLAALPSIDAPGAFLERFVATIASYPTHVRAHPPAAVAVGSGDAIFLGVGAWSVAALVHATSLRPRSSGAIAWSLAGGVLGGIGLFLTYGLVLLGVVPLAVIVARRRADVAAIAAVGVSTIALAFAASGFWWWDGLTATRLQYALSVARSRPYAYYLVANLAAFSVALGPAVLAAVPRLRDRRLWLLVGAGVGAVVLADVSGLSKAEVERIWLPFVPWIAVAAAVHRRREVGPWLGAQLCWALAVQLLVRSPW